MKTVLGYHDKKKEHYGILEGKLPMLVDERYDPFLMTTREFFTIKTLQIADRAHAHPVKKSVTRLKNAIATALLIPGILTAILYILEFGTAIARTGSIIDTIPGWLINVTFWLAVWGGMILWHETYKTMHVADKIAESEHFSGHDVKAVKQGDLGLSKRTYKNVLDMLEYETESIFYDSVRKGEFHAASCFTELAEHENGMRILDRLGLLEQKQQVLEKLATEETLPSYSLSATRSLLVYAAEEAVLSRSPTIAPEHLFTAYFKLFPALNQYLKKQRLNIELMRFVATWIQIEKQTRQATQILNPSVPYYRNGGIALSWIYGYTFVLSHYSTDLTQELARKGGRYGIGHEEEMTEILSVLNKVTKNNVLLIGESGTGKTSLAKGIAERINKGQVPSSIKDLRVIKLDINSLVAAAPQHGNLESLVKTAMEELEKAGNTILFIDEIQEIIEVKGEESDHSLAGIILPYVLESSFPIIGTITYADYKKYFQAKESLKQSFQTVEVKEVSPHAAFEIILTRLTELESTYDLKILFPAILAAVELSQRYVYDRKLPDSAVNVIETTCASLQSANKHLMTTADVSKTVSELTEIPVSDVSTEEATKLLDLEEKLKTKVIGQNEAVHLVVEALKRARAGTRDERKPIGTFLFLGPTGVGKTHLAKMVGEEFFGETHKIIRLDMSEYKDTEALQRLLGTTVVSDLAAQPVTFLDHVAQHPYSVVLLDEIEKAHPQVLDLFLQVLDEGRLTNAQGETINFTNTIIIATSNIGSKTLLESLSDSSIMFEDAKTAAMQELRNEMRIEFLNRFDQIIVFSPHSQENLEKISLLLLKELKGRLLEREISIDWDDSLPSVIAQRSRQPGLGARPIRRYIQDHVETIIAERILRGEISSGDTFTITGAMLSENTASQE
jgi:ATP-dependent Clp protease ATP-binding subunit ClpC